MFEKNEIEEILDEAFECFSFKNEKEKNDFTRVWNKNKRHIVNTLFSYSESNDEISNLGLDFSLDE